MSRWPRDAGRACPYIEESRRLVGVVHSRIYLTPKIGAMTESENEPAAYPQYDENGKQSPLRLPLTENSEQWEIDLVAETQDYELSGKPNYAFRDR